MNRDFRKELNVLFRNSLREAGLPGTSVKFDGLWHTFSHGYLRSDQLVVVGGTLHCPELKDILRLGLERNYPVFQYIIGHQLKMDEGVIYLNGGQFDATYLQHHFDLLARNWMVPIVTEVRAPIEAAQYAYAHPGVVLASKQKTISYVKRWYSHYGLPFEDPPWAVVEED